MLSKTLVPGFRKSLNIQSEIHRLAVAGIFVGAAAHIVFYVFLHAPYAIQGYADFSSFYTAGRIVQSGTAANLYDYETQWQVQQECCRVPIRSSLLPFVHAPHEALLFAVLARFSYRVAYETWTVMNLAILVLIAFVLREYARTWLPHWSLLLVAALASFPVLMTFTQGQDSLLLAFIYLGVFVYLKSERPTLAGVCLAFGMFKPQLIVPFVAILVLRKAWKPALGFLIGTIAIGIVSIAVVGQSGLHAYLKFLVKFDQMPAEISGALPGQMPNLRGLLVTAFNGLASPQVVTGLVLAASASVIWLAATRCAPTIESQFSAALTATTLASYHFNAYDAVLLLLPVVLSFGTLRSRPAKTILSIASALWFISPAIFMLVKYNLVCLLGIGIAGIAFALWLDRPRSFVAA